MNKPDIVALAVCGQPTGCVTVDRVGLFRIHFAFINIRHRRTVDDHIRIMFSQEIAEHVVRPEVELRERHIERRSYRVIRTTDSPVSLPSCVDDITSEESVRSNDEEPHIGVFEQ